jgi:hypothetical protein
MEYKQFIINAFEPEPGRWRARVQRANGKPLKATGRTKLEQFVTGIDAASPDIAMVMAMEAIDAGSFSRHTTRSTERFWRRGGDAMLDSQQTARGRQPLDSRQRVRASRHFTRSA